MGRTEKQLTRLRERLADAPPEIAVLQEAAGELAAMADAVPRADAPLAPVLDRLARGLEAREDAEATLQALKAAVDAALEYAARREHPGRGALLEVAAELVDACVGDPGPAAGAGGSVPASFVGDLPPESTLDDAAVLLVQLEPSDRYGIDSLVSILGRLAESHEGTAAHGPLTEAVRLLTASTADRDALDAVGEILEALGEDEPAETSVSATVSPASPGTAEISPDPDSEATGAGPAPGADDAPVSWVPGPDTDEELLREFLVESGDLLASAEQALLGLEADPEDVEAVNVVFRAFHTIKGTSGFLGIEQAGELCHHSESLLDRVRDGSMTFGTAIADLCLEAVDVLGAVLEDVRLALDGSDPVGVPMLVDLVDRLEGAAGSESAAPVASARRAQPEAAPDADGGSRPPASRGRVGLAGRDPDRETTVRVQTDRLDRLVDMVGELVISHSMIAQDPVVQDDSQHGLAKKVGHSGKIVRELQDLSMALRMVPLKSTFAKLRRLVRDLARKSGKQVRLETEGEDTEIDRTMVDTLGDPLVHMIRNAMDHGIESTEERESEGKPAAGTLWLRSYHAGGNVVVELEDDGRGMNRDRIVAKAVERGLVRSGEGLTDGEVWKLAFEPGFSTADTVTDVSGRGVGMDVVRRNIEALRGRIEVDSTPGEGTRMTLRLPLTLAITEGMLMRVGSERYILPTLSIERNVRPTEDMLSTVADRGEMLLLRDELLPIIRLQQLFGVAEGCQRLEDGLLVVIAAAERRCALLVDELMGQQQMVVKSLGEGLGKIRGVTGGAVLGDGTIGLILDAGELVSLARNRAAAAA